MGNRSTRAREAALGALAALTLTGVLPSLLAAGLVALAGALPPQVAGALALAAVPAGPAALLAWMEARS